MNGISAVYLVDSVMALSRSSRSNRDNQHSDDSRQKRNESKLVFADILGMATKERK